MQVTTQVQPQSNPTPPPAVSNYTIEQRNHNLRLGREKRLAEIASRKRDYEEALSAAIPAEEVRRHVPFSNSINYNHVPSIQELTHLSQPDPGISYADTLPYWEKIAQADDHRISILGKENRYLSDRLSALEAQLKDEDTDSNNGGLSGITVLCLSAAVAAVVGCQYYSNYVAQQNIQQSSGQSVANVSPSTMPSILLRR